MLGNSEKIENVDRKAVFNKMLAEVPWENLKAYILSNAQLTKLCTSGGFRLDVKFRKRAESFIQRDAEKNHRFPEHVIPPFAWVGWPPRRR